MEKVIGKNGYTVGDFQLLNTQRHSNCLPAHAHTTPIDPSRICNHAVLNSVTQIASERRGKTTRGKYFGERQPLYRQDPKAIQQVSAFGPAHAEQARKLYQFKGTTHKHRHKNSLSLPHRCNINYGSVILLSQPEQTQNCRNGGQLPKESEHCGQRVQHGTSCKREVILANMLEQNQPILKWAKLSSRPGKYTSKMRNALNVEDCEYAREDFVGKKPLNYKNGVREKDLSSFTILQILESISSTLYLH